MAHFRQLSQFYVLATQCSLLHTDVFRVNELAISFVQKYEELYYQGLNERLPVCSVNIHYLLHFADYIQDCGPARYWWQFPMERYCGIIKPKARSKSQLNASLANAVIISEHLNHVRFVRNELTAESNNSFPILLDQFTLTMRSYQRTIIQTTLGIKLPEQVHAFKQCQLRQDLILGSMRSQHQSVSIAAATAYVISILTHSKSNSAKS